MYKLAALAAVQATNLPPVLQDQTELPAIFVPNEFIPDFAYNVGRIEEMAKQLERSQEGRALGEAVEDWFESDTTQKLLMDVMSDPDVRALEGEVENVVDAAEEEADNEPEIEQTDDGYLITFKDGSLENIAVEVAAAMKSIEAIATDPENQKWAEDAMMQVMMDPAFADVEEKAMAFERKYGYDIENAANRLGELLERRLMGEQDSAEMDKWLMELMPIINVIAGAGPSPYQGGDVPIEPQFDGFTDDGMPKVDYVDATPYPYPAQPDGQAVVIPAGADW